MAPSQKTMLFVCLLVAAVAVVVPVAQAQIKSIIGGLLGPLYNIQGVLFCTVNATATVGTGGVVISPPPFANATVQLRCGGAGNDTVVASVMTNNMGKFSIILDATLKTLSQLLSGCRVVVATPLASCNAALPATGNLVANLTAGAVNIIPTVGKVISVNATVFILQS